MTTHVLVIRHPDYGTEIYTTDPEIVIHEFDLGSSFDITNLHNEDLDQVQEMYEDVVLTMKQVPELAPYLEHLEQTLREPDDGPDTTPTAIEAASWDS